VRTGQQATGNRNKQTNKKTKKEGKVIFLELIFKK
jgi:hypothetical protein